MGHLNDRVLEKLVDGSASTSDVQRILRHVEECRACGRRLEEWRDNFQELDERFPELAVGSGHQLAVTPGGMVLLPTEEPRRRVDLDLTTILWILAVLMALLVGYGASRLRNPNEGMATAGGDAVRPPRSGTMSPALPPTARPEGAPAGSTGVRTGAPVEPEHAATDPSASAPDRPTTRPSPAPATADRPLPAEALIVSPGFRVVRASEAASRLGGPLRLLGSLAPDHVEIGPPSAVPGAQHNAEVIRVVYKTPDGNRMLLDQQLIPADSNGFRPIDDPTLESGETAYGTTPSGVSVATWLDENGYRISLAVLAPLDSLRRLVPMVR